VFDCDGTLWRGNALIEGVADALQLLRDMAGFPFWGFLMACRRQLRLRPSLLKSWACPVG
jgi:hypothetical protein